LLLVQAGCGSASTTATDQPAAPAAATGGRPAFGQTVRLSPVNGRVRISLPGGARTFVPLGAPRLVPVGTVVDTTAGTVKLTSATPPPTHLQTGEFHAGRFEIRQSPSERGLVNLVIRDQLSRRRACIVRAAPTSRLLGLLRGKAVGRFRTTGRFAAGTVRGTEWGVRDRCDGTLVVDTRGSVAVRDFRRGKTIVLHAGQTYLATAP
jgi:hypothetical protein